jgi:glyoxylase-like metal-dependent hydrolase (beta-lactamase superfamily II)
MIQKNPEVPFKRFHLGDLELTIISDGYQVMRPAHPIFAPFTAPELVKQLLEEKFRPTEFVDLSLHILLIRKGDHIIMIDSGLGQSEFTGGKLQQALASAGIDASEISTIILTHAHTDHIGGLMDNDGTLVFPSAKIYMTKIEFEFWTSKYPDFTASALKNDKDQVFKLCQDIKNRLELLKPQLYLIELGKLLFECIELIAAPGHTPGHVIVRVFSGNEELMHIADIVHSEVLLFPHPEWGFAFDIDFKQAVVTRRKILTELAQSKTLTLAYHLPWPGLGYVRQISNAFEWIPKAYSTPNR